MSVTEFTGILRVRSIFLVLYGALVSISSICIGISSGGISISSSSGSTLSSTFGSSRSYYLFVGRLFSGFDGRRNDGVGGRLFSGFDGISCGATGSL